MIIGDPFEFAVGIQVVPEWNIDKAFNNGLLLLYLKETPYPSRVVSATLNTELIGLRDSLAKIPVNRKLFSQRKETAFQELYNITFPADLETDNNYDFFLSPDSLQRSGFFVFGVSSGKNVRIMASQLICIKSGSRHLLENIAINEVVVPLNRIKTMTRELSAAIRKIRE